MNLEVRNVGKASATDVVVKIALLEKGVPFDEEIIYIEYLGSGAAYPISTMLDYTAFHEYQFLLETKCREGSYESRKSAEFTAYPDVGSMLEVLKTLSWLISLF